MLNSRQPLLFGGPARDPLLTSAAMAALRIYTGLALALAHGIGKVPPQEGFVEMVGAMGFPAPGFFGWMAGVAEFFGGLLLALGLLTRPAALLVLLNMFVVVFVFHIGFQGDPFGDYELGLFFLFAALVFLVRGSGPVSVDALIRRRGARRG